MKMIWAEQALLDTGWTSEVLVEVDDFGKISQVSTGKKPSGYCVGVLLPAPVNIHSHAFQRAMAGLTEMRGPDASDSFWTWRKLMYRFLDRLDPEQVEAIAAWVQLEMLESGYAACAEFHYLHHQPGGQPYDNLAELSERIVAAASATGIGLTLLPVLYTYGGCDGRELNAGQERFGNGLERFVSLHAKAADAVSLLGKDSNIGYAPHSLRAVSRQDLGEVSSLSQDKPIHMHIAEQLAEVHEVKEAYGQRPVEWLLDNISPDETWCLIHCTQMTEDETIRLAASKSVAGLCPITESNLGDGIFDGVRWFDNQGIVAVGSDSNVRVSLNEELRTLEYSQRLRDHSRAALADTKKSAGRRLFDAICSGGAQAAARSSGVIAPGNLADFVSLDMSDINLLAKTGDSILDSWIFTAGDKTVSDVWSAGRHLVQEGRHIAREKLEPRYRKVLKELAETI